MLYSLKAKRVFVAGHNGMVGRAITRLLEKEDCEILTVDREVLDLRDQQKTHEWMRSEKPEAIFLAAAKVGGIATNSALPADFLYDNVTIAGNVIHASYLEGVEKLLFLGSSCIYPKNTSQPIKEKSMLTGELEPSNQWYAIAKITGLKMCEAYREQYGCDFISAMPTNLYGPFDNFDLETSHVLPALINKIHQAKIEDHPNVSVWGTGKPRREFLHVDDLAAALVFLMKNYSDAETINIGCGEDLSIKDLANMITKIVGYGGELIFDTSKPDGTMRKLLDISKISSMGWQPKVKLKEGVESSYNWYLKK